MTNEPITTANKPSGCWWRSGCLLTIISVFLIIVAVLLMIDSERRLDEKRAEYAASYQEYEDAMKVYEADSAHLHAEYQRIQEEIDAAELRGDTTLVMALEDSLAIYAEPEYNPRGVIGFNIAGAFYALFIVIMLIPFFIGIVMIAIYRYKKGKYDKQNREAILNNP